MFGLQKSLRNSKNDVYVSKCNDKVSKRCNDLGYVKCGCGSTHFRYEQEVVLAGFSFYGYTCMACGELMFVDKEAMIDSPYLQTICNESVLEHNCNIILDKVI